VAHISGCACAGMTEMMVYVPSGCSGMEVLLIW
jgi:hypothetical protein